MITNKFKFGFLGASLLLAVVGCSSDKETIQDTDPSNNNVISNADITLTHGSSALNNYVSLKNTNLPFNRIANTLTPRVATFAVSSYTENYTATMSSDAKKISGSGSFTIDSGQEYYIAEGETFTGNINFNGAGKLYILGNLNSNNVNVPAGGYVEVASTGSILASSGFQLNSGSELINYGRVSYSKNTIDGSIVNHKNLTFTSNINLNGSSRIINNCSLVFGANTQINADIINHGYVDFQGDVHINGGKSLILDAGSLTDFSKGKISIDGIVRNAIGSGVARIDIGEAVTFGNMNATPAFTGLIDINLTIALAAEKIGSGVGLNGDIPVGDSNGCIPMRGDLACNDDALSFTLAATILSPKAQSEEDITLSATGVEVVNGKAYVSYHTNDERFGNEAHGSIRIFDIQNHSAPSLLAQADFNKAEFNNVDVVENMLYAVGGNKAGARLVTAQLNNGMFNTSDLSVIQTHKIPSLAGKNSFIYNDKLWVVSGSTGGGFFQLDPANEFAVSEKVYEDGQRAKYVAENDNYQAFFAVETTGAYLRIANIDGSNVNEYRFPELQQTVNTGKNVIVMDKEYVYVALSDRGVAKIELATGKLVNHFEPNTYRKEGDENSIEGQKVFKHNGYTNGVAINDCYLYLANGNDGVIVLNKNSFHVVGSIKLSESANYVYAKDGLLFVATGQAGLSIITIN